MRYDENFRKTAAYQQFQFALSYQHQQWSVLAVIVSLTVLSAYVCSPEVTYILMILTYLVVGYGDSLTDKRDMARRRIEDFEAVSDEAFTQIAYNEMLSTEAPVESIDDVQLSDGMGYLREAAANWRSHLGLLAPTDTGKSSTMVLLLALMSRKQRIMVIAVESKGAEYPGVPNENVLRIGFRPSRAEVQTLIALMQAICDLAQGRADKVVETDYQLVLILEEWLSIYNTINNIPGLKDLAPVVKSFVYTLVGVGRGCGVQVILTAQSNVADDLGVSGSVRSNLRYMALGSTYGGFEGIENAFANYRIVSPSRREQCQRQFEAAIKKLRTNRHPLILTNLVGRLEIFPAPYLKESEMSQLRIESLPIEPRFLTILGEPTNAPDPLLDDFQEPEYPLYPQVFEELGIVESSEKIIEMMGTNKIGSLEELESLILGFLESKPKQNFRASEIRKNVRELKDKTDLFLVEKVCEGLVSAEQIIRITEDGSKPRYMAR